MKAKISKKGLAFLKSTQASKALVEAVVNNSYQLSNGNAVPFMVSVNDGSLKEVAVKKVTSF